MLSRWVRYRRVVWLVLLLATVFGLGLWAGGRNGRPAAVIGVVNVAHSKSGEHAYGNIEIKQRAIHVTASGERILIIHGHELDAVVQNVKWLAFAGDLGYQFLLSLNPLINFIRRRFGLGYWSLSAYAKRRVKDAVSFIGKFEAAVAHYAERYHVDAVLCGHIHSAAIREFGNVNYYNCGDWVESCTALVEGDDGILSMLNYHPCSVDQISRNRMTESLPDEQSLLACSD